MLCRFAAIFRPVVNRKMLISTLLWVDAIVRQRCCISVVSGSGLLSELLEND